jgi:hypothetical protein
MLVFNAHSRVVTAAGRLIGPAATKRGFLVQYLIAAALTVLGLAGIVILAAMQVTVPEILNVVVIAGLGFLYGAQQAGRATRQENGTNVTK